MRLLGSVGGALAACVRLLGRGELADRVFGSLRIDASKATELLGWEPPQSIEEGFERTAAWYKYSQSTSLT